MKDAGLWKTEPGKSLLDGGAPFYSIYRSKDKEWFTVSCIEPHFFKEFIKVNS